MEKFTREKMNSLSIILDGRTKKGRSANIGFARLRNMWEIHVYFSQEHLS
jgi:hypothetical protein